VSSQESLGEVVDELQERLDALEETMEGNVTGIHSRISGVEDRIADLEGRMDALEEDVQVANAASSSKKASKIDKAMDVLEMASRKRSGISGVRVDTGDVLGAANCSSSRARGLMDEMAGAIDGAETETPGGPNPKVLRLPLGERDLEELQEELLEAWGEKE